jgi:hypothetical protein
MRMETKFEGLETRMETKFEGLETRMGGFEKAIGKMDAKLGVMVEEDVRQKVREDFGVQYANPFTARSIVDLILMLPEPFLRHHAQEIDHGNIHFLRNDVSYAVAEFLVKKDVPSKLLAVVYNVAMLNKDSGGTTSYSCFLFCVFARFMNVVFLNVRGFRWKF